MQIGEPLLDDANGRLKGVNGLHEIFLTVKTASSLSQISVVAASFSIAAFKLAMSWLHVFWMCLHTTLQTLHTLCEHILHP